MTACQIVKVADFGMVKELLNEASSVNSDPLNTGVGTYPYMSPEQWGYFDSIDQDTDVFSFGIILTEMLTGTRPFGDVRRFAGKRKQIGMEVRDHIKKYCEKCPESLISVVVNCLQFDPLERWKNEKESNSYNYFDTLGKNLISIYEELLKRSYKFPYGNDTKTDPDLYLMRGTSLSKFKEYKLAIKCYDNVIELAPEKPEGYNNKAIDLRELKNYEEALRYYNKALTLDPNHTNALSNKGNLLIDLGRYEEAIQICTKAIEIDPCHKRAYNNRARALTYLQRYEEAMKDLEKALEIDPEYTIEYN